MKDVHKDVLSEDEWEDALRELEVQQLDAEVDKRKKEGSLVRRRSSELEASISRTLAGTAQPPSDPNHTPQRSEDGPITRAISSLEQEKQARGFTANPMSTVEELADDWRKITAQSVQDIVQDLQNKSESTEPEELHSKRLQEPNDAGTNDDETEQLMRQFAAKAAQEVDGQGDEDSDSDDDDEDEDEVLAIALAKRATLKETPLAQRQLRRQEDEDSDSDDDDEDEDELLAIALAKRATPKETPQAQRQLRDRQQNLNSSIAESEGDEDIVQWKGLGVGQLFGEDGGELDPSMSSPAASQPTPSSSKSKPTPSSQASKRTDSDVKRNLKPNSRVRVPSPISERSSIYSNPSRPSNASELDRSQRTSTGPVGGAVKLVGKNPPTGPAQPVPVARPGAHPGAKSSSSPSPAWPEVKAGKMTADPSWAPGIGTGLGLCAGGTQAGPEAGFSSSSSGPGPSHGARTRSGFSPIKDQQTEVASSFSSGRRA
eukprot:104499-Rhodomonas_salina.1